MSAQVKCDEHMIMSGSAYWGRGILISVYGFVMFHAGATLLWPYLKPLGDIGVVMYIMLFQLMFFSGPLIGFLLTKK